MLQISMNAKLMSKFGPIKDKFSLGITDIKVSLNQRVFVFYLFLQIIFLMYFLPRFLMITSTR